MTLALAFALPSALLPAALTEPGGLAEPIVP
jgi:hypothetical protein